MKREYTLEVGVPEGTQTERVAGADDAKVSPVPIPNTEVKLGCAENTWLVTTREDR